MRRLFALLFATLTFIPLACGAVRRHPRRTACGRHRPHATRRHHLGVRAGAGDAAEECHRKRSYRVNRGRIHHREKLRGKHVVLFLSGISMVNASMNTQLVLDRFNVTHIVFSGIAGGVNPALNIGDVVVAERGTISGNPRCARGIAGQIAPPQWMNDAKLANFGNDVSASGGRAFEDDAARGKEILVRSRPRLLAVARTLNDVPLVSCDAGKTVPDDEAASGRRWQRCSGQAFVDNAAFREYTFKTFDASVLDMETAATRDRSLRQWRAVHRVPQP